VYTGLEKKGDHYTATDYDIFIDAPAFIGEFKVLDFETGARGIIWFSASATFL
jgi:predicted metalloprotease with PDZ domain